MGYFFRMEKLAVGYDGEPVVKHIDAFLRKGQILTLIGPNGSGKSTLLKSITRQLKPISGLIRLDGRSIEDINARDMARQTAVVLTERPHPELMTCGDVVAIGRYPYTGKLGVLSAEDNAKVEDALRVADALALKDRDFAEVSDGQLQRILLARAICQEPELLVLDEPTSFLDIRYAMEILDILRKMAAERGVTIIMSLHELYYAKQVSDLVLCVKDGRVLCLDTPALVFTEEIISSLYDLPDGMYQRLFGGL